MRPTVIVHGGVDTPPTTAVVDGLERAAGLAFARLTLGEGAVDGVITAVKELEVDPAFNAGWGSVLNRAGQVETDAGIADGKTGRFAGVAAMTATRNPIAVAAELLHRRPGPVLLVGSGADGFAREVGFAAVDLRTPEQIEAWIRARSGEVDEINPFTGRALQGADTVGCIAWDGTGVAAGSSTGGVFYEMEGRVGDAPISGAGIYADGSVAVLCSGKGEVSIELSLGLRTALKHQECGDPDVAARWAIAVLEERNAVGGVVVYDSVSDRVGIAHNASAFPVHVVGHGASGTGSRSGAGLG